MLTAERDRPHAAGYIKKELHGDLTAHYLLLTTYCLLLATVPMLRKTFTILSLIGLLLSVGLWPLSYLMPTFRTYHYQFFAQNGALSVTWISEPDRPESGPCN